MPKGLGRLIQLMEMLRAIDPEMPAQTVLTFLIIADEPDISMRDLQNRLGLASSSTSRNVAALSKHHRLGKDGADVVEAYEDPADRRYKRVRLTGKGAALTRRISQLVN
jgi:DNA-binding MarR family transcriptional regulator